MSERIICNCGLRFDEQALQTHAADCPMEMRIRECDRVRFHHEVLCLVLKEIYRSDNRWFDPSTVMDIAVNRARETADLAYPPPKAEGT